MIVLMRLIQLCLRCVHAPFSGIDQPLVPIEWAQTNVESTVVSRSPVLAPLHVPLPRRHR